MHVLAALGNALGLLHHPQRVVVAARASEAPLADLAEERLDQSGPLAPAPEPLHRPRVPGLGHPLAGVGAEERLEELCPWLVRMSAEVRLEELPDPWSLRGRLAHQTAVPLGGGGLLRQQSLAGGDRARSVRGSVGPGRRQRQGPDQHRTQPTGDHRGHPPRLVDRGFVFNSPR